MVNINIASRVSHDIPEFDAVMRRLVRVPGEVVGEAGEPKRAKGKSHKNH